METLDETLAINFNAIEEQKKDSNVRAVVKIYKRMMEKIFKYMKENNSKDIEDLKAKFHFKKDFYIILQDLLEEYLWLGKENMEVNNEVIAYVNSIKENGVKFTEDVDILLDTTIARAYNELAMLKESEDLIKQIINDHKTRAYAYFVYAGMTVDNGDLEKGKKILLDAKKVENLDLPDIFDEYIDQINEQLKQKNEDESDEEYDFDSDPFWN